MQESLAATKAERLDLEKQMVNEEGVIKELWNIAAKRITNDILDLFLTFFLNTWLFMNSIFNLQTNLYSFANINTREHLRT